MKVIVITGATRGIGYGLAKEFLSRGCAVLISGRSQINLDRALEECRQNYPDATVMGQICDVREPEQVQALWDKAVQAFGRIDLWVNNAGVTGNDGLLWDLPPETVTAVIETNVLGTFYGCQVAARGMIKQGSGAIYNMEGMGSDGRMHSGLLSYGTSKYATAYISRGLAKELSDTPIIIGALRPGMVVTDLLYLPYQDRPEEFERAKRIFNIIAERVETVTPWLVERMLSNTKSGVVLSFSSRWKLLWRFMTSPFVKRDLFDTP